MNNFLSPTPSVSVAVDVGYEQLMVKPLFSIFFTFLLKSRFETAASGKYDATAILITKINKRSYLNLINLKKKSGTFKSCFCNWVMTIPTSNQFEKKNKQTNKQTKTGKIRPSLCNWYLLQITVFFDRLYCTQFDSKKDKWYQHLIILKNKSVKIRQFEIQISLNQMMLV